MSEFPADSSMWDAGQIGEVCATSPAPSQEVADRQIRPLSSGEVFERSYPEAAEWLGVPDMVRRERFPIPENQKRYRNVAKPAITEGDISWQ
jgi:hypothetical protein